METVVWLLIILFSIVIHEVSHGLAAWGLGDRTAKDAGRLTLNPLKHIDPFWTVLLPAVLYFSTGGRFALGMAKPVPVNFNRLRSFRRDSILVSLAGPASNLLVAFLLAKVWQHAEHAKLVQAAYLNIGLAVFNLIPVPPLDGSRVVSAFLPYRFYDLYSRLEKIGFAVIAVLYMTGILMKVVIPGVQYFGNLLGLPPITLEF